MLCVKCGKDLAMQSKGARVSGEGLCEDCQTKDDFRNLVTTLDKKDEDDDFTFSMTIRVPLEREVGKPTIDISFKLLELFHSVYSKILVHDWSVESKADRDALCEELQLIINELSAIE